jgi:hypothetical protein
MPLSVFLGPSFPGFPSYQGPADRLSLRLCEFPVDLQESSIGSEPERPRHDAFPYLWLKGRNLVGPFVDRFRCIVAHYFPSSLFRHCGLLAVPNHGLVGEDQTSSRSADSTGSPAVAQSVNGTGSVSAACRQVPALDMSRAVINSDERVG